MTTRAVVNVETLPCYNNLTDSFPPFDACQVVNLFIFMHLRCYSQDSDNKVTDFLRSGVSHRFGAPPNTVSTTPGRRVSAPRRLDGVG